MALGGQYIDSAELAEDQATMATQLTQPGLTCELCNRRVQAGHRPARISRRGHAITDRANDETLCSRFPLTLYERLDAIAGALYQTPYDNLSENRKMKVWDVGDGKENRYAYAGMTPLERADEICSQRLAQMDDENPYP